MPLVSIIIPVFKQEIYLHQCLESISYQTFQNWECIIVNDGSDDPDLIDDITSDTVGNRGIVIHQNNHGLAKARNVGIAKASGSFLVCLDADDYLHPDFLTKTSAVLIQSRKPGVVYCWTRHFGIQHDLFIPPHKIQLFWLLQRNLIHVTCLFSKDILEYVGDFDEHMPYTGHEDWDFWIRVFLAGYSFTCVSEALFYYRKSSHSMIPTMAKFRVDTINYIRHKHSQIYFMPLKRLFTYSPFRGIYRVAIVRFWLTGLFFRYIPKSILRRIFRLYQRFVDDL